MSAHRTAATLVRCALAASGLLLPALAPRALQAQAGSGTLAATTEILLPGVTGTGDQELRFGGVSPGQTVDVPPGPAAVGATKSSAGWVFENIKKGHLVWISTTLPASLAKGSSTIPIDWTNANYGTICVAGSNGVCQVNDSFDPGAQSYRLLLLPSSMSGTNFDLRLYLGARITVPAAATPGTYSATVTANFAYLL